MCSVRLRLGRYSDLVKVYLAELADDWDRILGRSWLEPHCAAISFQCHYCVLEGSTAI